MKITGEWLYFGFKAFFTAHCFTPSSVNRGFHLFQDLLCISVSKSKYSMAGN